LHRPRIASNLPLSSDPTNPLSSGPCGRGLRGAGIPIVCVETRHTQRFLSSRPVKTDKNDARGIAEMMRLGHYRPVHVKAPAAQSMRTTLAARMQLVGSQLQIEGTIRGSLKVYGLKIGAIHRNRLAPRVLERLEMTALTELSAAIEPLLRIREVCARNGTEGIGSNPGCGGPALRRRSAPDDDPRRRASDHPCIDRHDRRPRAVRHLESARRPSRPDTARVSVGRDRQIGTNQQVRRSNAAAPSLRGRIGIDDPYSQVDPPARLGRRGRQSAGA
jgi:hypothetical protein